MQHLNPDPLRELFAVFVAVHYGFRGEILPHLRVSKHICHITHIVHKTVCMYVIQREKIHPKIVIHLNQTSNNDVQL